MPAVLAAIIQGKEMSTFAALNSQIADLALIPKPTDSVLFKRAKIALEARFWLDLGRRLARLPARSSAEPCLYPRVS